MKKGDFKENVINWIKTHPTPAKVIVVAVLVVLFCVILVNCMGEKEEKLVTKPSVYQNQVAMPAPAPVPAPAPAPEPAPASAPTEFLSDITLSNDVVLKVVPVYKGIYKSGSPAAEKGRNRVEKQRLVNISEEFYIGAYEVTQAQYKTVTGQNPSKFKGNSLPVENVTWDNAVMFCEKLNAGGYAPEGWKFAMPTSEQWEYACRAGTTTPFSWGSVLNGDKANCYGSAPYGTTRKGTYLKKTQPVGSYAANDWGIYDMHGNVSEWCQKIIKGKPTYELRGGSWATPAKDCRSAARFERKPSGAHQTIGFRVVLVKAE